MPDLLFELFSEEIPARMQAKAADDLRKMVTDKLVAEGLVYEGAKAFATPRRLALTVHGIPARQPDLKDERKGPKVGAPDAAVLALGLLLGIGNGLCIATKIALLQQEMPADLIGRVFGVDQALTSLVMLGAPLAGGLIIEASGARPAFAAFGLATAAVGLAGLLCAPALWGRGGGIGIRREA